MASARISIVDSHTAGEPTRVALEGGPELGAGSLAERLEHFRMHLDHYRAATVNEPRGSDTIVGALLCRSSIPDCAAAVIFFNNVGFLGMCGHGTIGLVTTLAYLGRLGPGKHRIETPVGVVSAELHPDKRVSVHNVPSYRYAKAVQVEMPDYGVVTGDVAWGGNWFFLTEDHGLELKLANLEALTRYARELRRALVESGVAGADGAEIDHLELFAPTSGADRRNFVLCPGGAYDRSPCGTGTSAKLACLAADGKLAPGEIWHQESIIGSRFEACYSLDDEGRVLPVITGRAFVTAEATLVLNEEDPFCWGIRG
jgi:4-hydroxyproline epimerase